VIATPFVQGRLRDEPLIVEIETECAHCGQPLHLTIDSDLRYQVRGADAGAEPLVFQPLIDWATFTDPNIIHAF
jgi:hypothetical protein